MKPILTFICAIVVAFTQQACAQMILLKKDAENGYQFEQVYTAEGKSCAEIYATLKKWLIQFSKAQSTSNYFDADSNRLISGNPVLATTAGGVDFKLNIEIKDGRYRVTGTAFMLAVKGGSIRLDQYRDAYVRKLAFKETNSGLDKMISAMHAAFHEEDSW